MRQLAHGREVNDLGGARSNSAHREQGGSALSLELEVELGGGAAGSNIVSNKEKKKGRSKVKASLKEWCCEAPE